jgi:hypothetical protein
VTAAEHDTTGAYPLENLTLLEEAGYLVAPIPEQLGGQGVESLYDILAASSRLARGDASTTLGLNMHLLVAMSMVHRWRIARHRGDERRATAFARSLQRIVEDGVVLAAAVSEPNQDLTRPAARAARNGPGWVLNGRKVFATMSPAATMLLVSADYEDPTGQLLYGYAEVPADAPGVTVHDDWDALGMRASGSNSVSLRDVHLPAPAVRGGFALGDATGYIRRNLATGLFHASASVGIAEAAHSTALHRLTRPGTAGTGTRPRPSTCSPPTTPSSCPRCGRHSVVPPSSSRRSSRPTSPRTPRPARCTRPGRAPEHRAHCCQRSRLRQRIGWPPHADCGDDGQQPYLRGSTAVRHGQLHGQVIRKRAKAGEDGASFHAPSSPSLSQRGGGEHMSVTSLPLAKSRSSTPATRQLTGALAGGLVIGLSASGVFLPLLAQPAIASATTNAIGWATVAIMIGAASTGGVWFACMVARAGARPPAGEPPPASA